MFGLDRVPGNEYQKTGRLHERHHGRHQAGREPGPGPDRRSTATRKYDGIRPLFGHPPDYDTPGLLPSAQHTARGRLDQESSERRRGPRRTVDRRAQASQPRQRRRRAPAFLSDQTMTQSAAGVFVLDRVELGPDWGASLSLRYDNVTCKVDDRIGGLSGDSAYKKGDGAARADLESAVRASGSTPAGERASCRRERKSWPTIPTPSAASTGSQAGHLRRRRDRRPRIARALARLRLGPLPSGHRQRFRPLPHQLPAARNVLRQRRLDHPIRAGDVAGLVPHRSPGRAARLHVRRFKYD